MNLMGKKVVHKMLGTGTVVAQGDKYISVEFAARTSKFSYPDQNTFTKFLQAEDQHIQSAILQEIADAKAVEEANQRAEQEAQRRAEEQRSEKATARRISALPTCAPKKAGVKQERIPGKRMTFYVFQGTTYDRESRGGYIWAPVSNKNGNKFHHWDRLLDIKQGDIILHGYNGYIQAISTAKSECYESNQPDELRTEDLWDKEGRRVDCDYILIERPIKTSAFVEDIIRLCNVKYAPFDKYGNGNMGYLYKLNRELACIFLRAAVKSNPYLEEVDYIVDLLAEGIHD